MRYSLKTTSARGKLIKKIDSLFFQILIKDRGRICEVHNKPCPQIGTMHILSKGAHPKLRYCKENVLLAGWFCSHFWTHHNPDDKRAIYAKERIIALRGPAYKDRLLAMEVMEPKHSTTYLSMLYEAFKAEAKEVSNG